MLVAFSGTLIMFCINGYRMSFAFLLVPVVTHDFVFNDQIEVFYKIEEV